MSQNPSREDNEIAEAYRNGATLHELARRFGMKYSAVRRKLVEMGVKLRAPGPPRKLASPEMVSDYESGSSIHEVAVRHDLPKSTVRNMLLAAGVTLRPPSTATKGATATNDEDRQSASLRIADMCLDRSRYGLKYEEIGKKYQVSRETARLKVQAEFRRRGESDARLSDISFYAEMYESGATLIEVARAARINAGTLTRRLQAAGVTVRKKQAEPAPDGFVEAYNNGLTYDELAERFNTNRGTIGDIVSRTPSLKRRRRRISAKLAVEMAERRLNDNMSYDRIGREYGFAGHSVRLRVTALIGVTPQVPPKRTTELSDD